MRSVASGAALLLEIVAVVFVVVGATSGVAEVARGSRRGVGGEPLVRNKEAFLRFASWLVLGLEFELAADIVRTAISPSWTDIGKLGAIAVIRTGLNYFLERDLEHYVQARGRHGASVATSPSRAPVGGLEPSRP